MDYTVALVTYLDVLGFKEILEERSVDEIRGILDLVRTETQPDEGLAKTYDQSFFNFSDLVVRVINVLSEANKRVPSGLLFHELLDLATAQARLAYRGVLVRGGVAIGEIVATDKMVFGPALVRAHGLESQMALYPRIVVDPDVLLALDQTRLLKKDTHDHHIERGYVLDLLTQGDDGVHFVDYLRVVATEDPEHWRTLIETHRDLVVSRAEELAAKAEKAGRDALDSTTVKMSWLGNYHNKTVEILSQDASLKVPMTALKMVYQPPSHSTASG